MIVDEKFIKAAYEMAKVSGELIKKYYRNNIKIEEKEEASNPKDRVLESIVTIADKEIEKELRDIVEQNFKDHGIIGEEYPNKNEDADYVWVFDPIDGTKAFVMGIPVFATLISLLYKGKPVLGIINQPITNELWFGAKGHQSTLNNKPIKTRKCKNLNDAFLSAYSLDMFAIEKDKEAFLQLKERTKYCVFSCSPYTFGSMAMGLPVDIIAEHSAGIYDFASHVPIIEGAGGSVTDWQGNPITIDTDGHVLAISDPDLLPEVLKILN